jgi:hypothetical protein
LAIEADLFDKALEKLWIHKGAVLDFAENVSQGDEQWRSSYIQQGDQKRAQIDQMIRFAESNQCRMTSLVRHFGDTSDSARACGVCDFCAPAKCVAQRFRTATEAERTALYRVLRGMRSVFTKSTGKLYAELYPGNEISRDNFEEVLGAMARAELLTFADAVFEKQGKQIPYRTVTLTPAGRAVDESVLRGLFPSANERRTQVSPRHLRGLQLERNLGRQELEQLCPSRRFVLNRLCAPGDCERGEAQKDSGISGLWRSGAARYRCDLSPKRCGVISCAGNRGEHREKIWNTDLSSNCRFE